MSTAPARRPFDSETARRRLEARRRVYFRRRMVALLVLLAILTGLTLGVRALVLRFWPADKPADAEPAASSSLPFVPKSAFKVGDLNGDGTGESVAIGPIENGMRQAALLTGGEKEPRVVGEQVVMAGFDAALVDLPRARSVLVLYQKLPAEGLPEQITVADTPALKAMGGEPDYLAWQPDMEKGLVPADYYQLAAPLTPPEPTALVVDKYLNVLWHYEDGQLTGTYRIATGSHLEGPVPSKANQAANFLTPEGRFTIANRIPGLPYYKEQIPALDPRNPLGTRWLGFSVFEGDSGMLWSIHGTNQPEQIGSWNTTGSIIMQNEDLEELYERVQVGTPLIITSSRPAQ